MANSKYTSPPKSSSGRDLLSDARLDCFMRDDGLAYQQRLLSGNSARSSSRSSAQPPSYSSYSSYYSSYGGAQPQPRPRQ